MKRILVIEKHPEIKMIIVFSSNWASNFKEVEFFKRINFDIIVINVLVLNEEFPVIKEMSKNSKVILVAPLAISNFDTEQITNLIDRDITITSYKMINQIINDCFN
ncbi:hypothetical protein KAS41_04630 [Candidatus Parcubacteria bacterium]|nr:hypothetical protein [Candidatus Parcubacteria bacterium]